MTRRLPLLHPPALCRRGGDVCDDYEDHRKGVCRHLLISRASDAEGAFIVPLCGLAQLEAGAPLGPTDVGEIIGESKQAVTARIRKALKTLRGKAETLRDALDADLFARTRKPIVPDDSEAA